MVFSEIGIRNAAHGKRVVIVSTGYPRKYKAKDRPDFPFFLKYVQVAYAKNRTVILPPRIMETWIPATGRGGGGGAGRLDRRLAQWRKRVVKERR